MAWHQHLYCRLLLLLSKAVLKGDGFLIEIQSIGAEAGRAQRECTSGEIALGRVCVCVGGEGTGAGGPAHRPAQEPVNELQFVGICRSPLQRICSAFPAPWD